MRLTFIFLLATALLPAQKRPATYEDIFLLKPTGEAAPSPDGKWAVFSVTEPDYDPTKAVSDLWIVPVDGSVTSRRVTSIKAGRGVQHQLDRADPAPEPLVFLFQPLPAQTRQLAETRLSIGFRQPQCDLTPDITILLPPSEIRRTTL